LTGWRGGTRKGFDLTFGSPVSRPSAALPGSTIILSDTKVTTGDELTPTGVSEPSHRKRSSGFKSESDFRAAAAERDVANPPPLEPGVKCRVSTHIEMRPEGDIRTTRTGLYRDAPSAPIQGDSGMDVRGGILIRGLLPVSGGPAIIGPSLCVDAILSAAGATSIKELVTDFWVSDTSALEAKIRQSPVWLELKRPSRNMSVAAGSTSPVQTSELELIYSGPRVGLELSHPGTLAVATDPRVRFVAAPLRFFRRPQLFTSKGRAHTLLAVLRTLHPPSPPSPSTLSTDDPVRIEVQAAATPNPVPKSSDARLALFESLSSATGLGLRTVTTYMEAYEAGWSDGDISRFVGSKGKGVGAKADAYMRMAGTLDGMGVTRSA
jgi:hypothetical protein